MAAFTQKYNKGNLTSRIKKVQKEKENMKTFFSHIAIEIEDHNTQLKLIKTTKELSQLLEAYKEMCEDLKMTSPKEDTTSSNIEYILINKKNKNFIEPRFISSKDLEKEKIFYEIQGEKIEDFFEIFSHEEWINKKKE